MQNSKRTNLSGSLYIRSIVLSGCRKVSSLYRSKQFLTPWAILSLHLLDHVWSIVTILHDDMEFDNNTGAGEPPSKSRHWIFPSMDSSETPKVIK